MDLRQIEYFTQLYNDLNITKASKNLFISQQGLSKSLSKLEAEIGLPLFKRNVQGIVPTEAAKLLYSSFEKVTAAYYELLEEISHVKGRRTLNIGAPEFFSMCFDRNEFGLFERDHPDITVNYREMPIDEITQDLLSGNLDIGYVISPVSNKLKTYLSVSEEPVYVIMDSRHRLSKRDSIRISDLNANVLLFLSYIPEINRRIQQEVEKADLEYRVQDVVSASEFIVRIHGSYLLGIGSRKLFQYFDFPDICYVPLVLDDGSHLSIETNLVYVNGRNLTEEAVEYLEYRRDKKTEREEAK